MAPEFFALLAAFCFAGSHITSKRGLVTASVPAAVLISLSAAFVLSCIAALLNPPGHIDLPTIATFAAAGLIAPGIARWAATMGVDKLGPSTSVPIAQGTNPLIATLGGVVFLNESLSASNVAGIVAIVLGSFFLARQRPTQLSAETPEGESSPPAVAPRTILKPGIVFPLIAAASYASSALLAKRALTDPEYAAFGTAVGMGAALTAWALTTAAVKRLREQVVLGDGLKWLILSGLLTGSATLYLFSALRDGNISIVSPIAASQALIVFLLSSAMLRGIEEIRLVTIIAGTVVAAGTTVLVT